jgi:transcriptional regulator with XRE-family HTH domain
MKPEVAKTVQDFPAALKRLREGSGLRQVQVSWRSGLSKAQVSSFETGKVLPSVASLIAYLSGVGRDLSDLQQALTELSGLPAPPPTRQEDRERVVGRAVIRSFKVLLDELGLEPGTSANDALAQEIAERPRP